MTSNLWLYDPNGNPTKTLANGKPSDLNFPAHWTTNQQGLFRSSIDSTFAPGDSRFGSNQYCDADAHAAIVGGGRAN